MVPGKISHQINYLGGKGVAMPATV